MGSPAIFKGPKTQLLTQQGLKLKNGANKDIVVGTVDPTVTPVDADAGSLYLRDGTDEIFVHLADGNNTQWRKIKLGEAIQSYNADFTDVSQFVTGNDAIFDNGGTFQGTFTKSTVAAELINGNNVFKWVGNATAGNNDDDFIAAEARDIPKGFRGKFVSMSFDYRWDGGDTNLLFRVKDTTNGDILNENLAHYITNYEDATNGTTGRFNVAIFIPPTTEQVEIGFQVETGEVSRTFIWDELEINEDIASSVSLEVTQDILHTAGGNTLLNRGGTSNFVEFNLANFTYQGIGLLIASSNSNRTEFLATKDCTVNAVLAVDAAAAGGNPGIVRSREGSRIIYGSMAYVGTATAFVSSQFDLKAGEFFYFSMGSVDISNNGSPTSMNISVRAKDDYLITPATSNGNNFTAQIANNGTASISDQGGRNNLAQNAIASINRTSTGTIDVTWTAGFFTTPPTITATPGTLGSAGSADMSMIVDNISTTGCRVVTSFNSGGGVTRDVDFNMHISRSDGDHRLDFQYAQPVDNVVYIKESLPNNTNGGDFFSGAWRTREVNEVSGNTSLASINGSFQFLLAAGTWRAYGEAVAHNVLYSKVRLRNITDGSNAVVGLNTSSSSNADVPATLMGEFSITEAKLFELQHRCQTSNTTNARGVAFNFGENEVFAQLTLEKVR